MAQVLKLKNSQAALVANNSHAGNVDLATTVRIYNNAGSFGNVTVQTVSALSLIHI